MKDLKFRNKLAQENFDYYVWNCQHISEPRLTRRLYDKGFTKSEARQAVAFIYNQTIKAYNAR